MFGIITDVLGIIGFIFSLVNFVFFFAVRRKKIAVRFDQYGIHPYYENTQLAIIPYRIDNLSEISISITRVCIIIDNVKYDCCNTPEIAAETTNRRNGEIYRHSISETDILPLNLESLSSKGGFFAFPIPQDSLSKDETHLNFQICTNRGKAIQKSFVLCEDTKCS